MSRIFRIGIAATTAMLLSSGALCLAIPVPARPSAQLAAAPGSEVAFRQLQNQLVRAQAMPGEPAASITTQANVPLRDLQALLRPDEVVLIILPSETRSSLLAVTSRDTIRQDRPIGQAAIDRALIALNQDMDVSMVHRGPDRASPETIGTPSYNRMLAWDLYRSLFGDMTTLFATHRRIMVIAPGSLGRFPLAALVKSAPHGDDRDPSALRDTDWLGRDNAFIQETSVTQLVAGLRMPLRDWSGRYFGIGGSSFGSSASPVRDGYLMNPATLRQLAALAGTRHEIQETASLFATSRQTVFLGAAATETAVRQSDLASATVIHFATGGMSSAQSPSHLAGMFLSPPAVATQSDDGYLDSEEIGHLHLTADIVLASACSTQELTDAFFRAGARSALVTTGAVEDLVAGQFIPALMRDALANPDEDFAAAFLRAQDMIRKSSPYGGHPSQWAMFVLAGDPPVGVSRR